MAQVVAIDRDQPTTVLSGAGASINGNAYSVPSQRGIGGLPAALVVQVTGTVGSGTGLQGSLDNTNWYNLQGSTGVSAAGLSAVNNPPVFIRGVTGTGASGVTIIVVPSEG